MRNKRRTDEEWLSLIQQCRSSGFSDRVWCEQNDISINTFFNTVTRLRKKSCMIPETDRLTVDATHEIVQLFITEESHIPISDPVRPLTRQEFRWLMEGLSIDQPKAIQPAKGRDF